MERMTVIALGGMAALALLAATVPPEGGRPVGPASAVGWQAAPVQVSESARTVEAG